MKYKVQYNTTNSRLKIWMQPCEHKREDKHNRSERCLSKRVRKTCIPRQLHWEMSYKQTYDWHRWTQSHPSWLKGQERISWRKNRNDTSALACPSVISGIDPPLPLGWSIMNNSRWQFCVNYVIIIFLLKVFFGKFSAFIK